ncbi:MAG: phosphonate C-P lyase system protein PhnH [Pseudomonadota bacterium]
MSASAALGGGFTEPPRQAAVAFRALLNAMARPGRIETVSGAVPPEPLSVAAGVALLVLCDPDTPLALLGAADCPEVREWVGFHTGAPLARAEECRFAAGQWDATGPLDRFPQGTPEYPDRSATLILEVPRLAPEGARLSGPGIQDTATLSLPDTGPFQQNARLFPLGLDFVLTSGTRLAALPRTTQVE